MGYYNNRPRRKIKAIWPSGKTVVYSSLKDAVKLTGVCADFIRRSIKFDEEYKGFRFFDVKKEEE